MITASQGFNLEYDKTIMHHVFSLYDSKKQNVMQYLDDADRKINAGRAVFKVGLRNGDVLVHCAAGVSRVNHVYYIIVGHIGHCSPDQKS